MTDSSHDSRYDSLRARCQESVHPDAHPYTIMERARLIQLAAHSAGFDEGHVEVEYFYNGVHSYMIVEGAGQATSFDRSGLTSATATQHVQIYVVCKANSMHLHQLVDVNRVMAGVQQYDLELRAIFGQCFKTSLLIELGTA